MNLARLTKLAPIGKLKYVFSENCLMEITTRGYPLVYSSLYEQGAAYLRVLKKDLGYEHSKILEK